jgi:putative iron-dependent peroxidase
MPQKGIFIEGTLSCLFLEFSIKKEADITQLKKTLLKVYEMNSDQLNIVIAMGRLGLIKLNVNVPDGLRDFKEIKGVNKLKMPGTQHEILIWIHSHSKSEIFDFSIKTKALLDPYLKIEIEQEGFRYHDSRDMMGFVDGSANPKGDKRQQEILIPQEQPNENGCYVFTQKWAHDLESFHSNTVAEQERIIGRTKNNSVELEGDAMPNNSHVSRVDVKVNNVAMKIYRRSFPYANNDNHGLFFLGFSKNIDRFDIQLRRMLGATEDKIHDKMMEFSIPLSGSYYFAHSDAELVKILSS